MKKIREIFSGNEGFTLIELLIVIVILGTLGAIAVPNLMGLTDTANEEAVKANMRTLMVELESFKAQNPNAIIDSSNEDPLEISFTHSESGQTLDNTFDSSAISSLNEQDVTFTVSVDGNSYDITAEPSGSDTWYIRIDDGAITTTGGKTSGA